MRSLWTDLLFLHGYITDPKLARRLASLSAPRQSDERASQQSPGAGVLRWTVRLCLGIGDGKLRTQ